jgi:phospholipase C
MPKPVTRRSFLKAGAAAVGAGVVGSTLDPSQARLIDTALAASSGGTLSDVKHVVILMQENRSFDHYFGTMPGVRGFQDTRSYSSFAGGPATGGPGVFHQSTAGTGFTVGGQSAIDPFELVSNPPTVDGQTTNDITHDWGPQHLAWHDGAMDQFAVQHLRNDGTAKLQLTNTLGLPVPGTSTVPIGPLTMGYLRQRDCLAFYRALADAFTICDGYFCSVLGPTDPNRLMWMSGSLGAHSGDVGGQVLTTYVQTMAQMVGTLDWPTMPEVLNEHGVSWKVYQDPTSNALFNVLDYFKNYVNPSAPGFDANLAVNGLAPIYPLQFATDVVAGTLP